MSTRRHNFLRVVWFFSILIPALITVSQPVTAQQDGLELFYTISVDEGKDTAHVDVNIQNLSQSSFRIGFFMVPKDIHIYISNLVIDSGESQSSIEYTSLNTWTITSQQKLSSIKIGYDISKRVPYEGGLSYVSTGGDEAVFINDLGGLLIGEYFFLVPIDISAKSIKVKFNLPPAWQLVTPYIDQGTYFEVPKVTNDLVRNFVQRQGVYFGMFNFYSEMMAGDSIIKFGVLKSDQAWDTMTHLSTQKDVDYYVQRTALAIEKYTEMFGDNPYPVISMYTNFKSDFSGTFTYPGTRELTGGYQYWPPNRYDELVGHLQYSWLSFSNDNRNEAPVSADRFIAKGLGESYLAGKLAYEITGDKAYLGKIYQYYLVYKRALNTQYMSIDEINTYYKGAVFGLYLDSLIQKETDNTKSIYDLFGYLYRKYRNSGHDISLADLEEAVNMITNKDNSVIFNRYIYGNEEIPVQDLIQPYKESFGAFLKVLESDAWTKEYHRYTIPFFVDIEMSIPSSFHIPFGLLIDNHYQQFAKYIIDNYDINKLTKEEVEASLSKLTGGNSIGFFDRWKDSYGELGLEEMKAWLRSYSLPKANGPSGGSKPVASVDLTDSAIKPDGNPSDWGNRQPSLTPPTLDSARAAGADISAVYVFADSKYLYLRLDQYGGFPNPPLQLLQYQFDLTSPEWGSRYYQINIPNSGPLIRLLPIEGTTLLFGEQKNYDTVAIGQVLEAVVPLEMLKNPSQIMITTYVHTDRETIKGPIKPLTVSLRP